MTRYNIEELKNSAVTYMKTQNNPVTYETVARKLGIERKVMKYIFFSHKDVFKAQRRYICSKRHVYTL